jgi:sugar lactone lactonase YvrE
MNLIRLFLVAVFLCTLPLAAQESTPEALERPAEVVVVLENLYPEGLAYDPIHERFFVSSTESSIVHAVDWDGTLSPFVEDERIPASFGLEVDTYHERLLVTATNRANQSFLGIYDLETGENLHYVDLKVLNPNSRALTFVNDVTVDAEGNAYATDSYAGIIYKVDIDGVGSVFLDEPSFKGNFALNGIAYHDAGNFLVAVQGRDLIKIPLDNPSDFAVIETGESLAGQDGLAFLDENTLVIASFSGGRVYRIESEDEFVTGSLTGTAVIGSVTPTTLANVDGSAYVLHSYLQAANSSVSEYPIQLVVFEEAE